MSSLITKVDARARRLPDPLLLAIALAMVAGLAAFKLTAGRGIPIVDFYLIPVAAVGWFTSSRAYGSTAAVVTAVVSVAVAVDASNARVGATVASGVARLVLYLLVLTFLGAMRAMQVERDREARTDHLTGACNARSFRALALAEIARARRYRHELSAAYLDLDDFKAINDGLGHIEGDHVLLQVSHVMRTTVRSVDTVARLGGDEFVVLLPETGASEARVVVDRLRLELARLSAKDGRPVPCSVGLVTFTSAPASLAELVDAADELMYAAKKRGKNRVEQAQLAGSAALIHGRTADLLAMSPIADLELYRGQDGNRTAMGHAGRSTDAARFANSRQGGASMPRASQDSDPVTDRR
jgi:diguanylate cyclase (GGDEF)-like protein